MHMNSAPAQSSIILNIFYSQSLPSDASSVFLEEKSVLHMHSLRGRASAIPLSSPCASMVSIEDQSAFSGEHLLAIYFCNEH